MADNKIYPIARTDCIRNADQMVNSTQADPCKIYELPVVESGKPEDREGDICTLLLLPPSITDFM